MSDSSNKGLFTTQN